MNIPDSFGPYGPPEAWSVNCPLCGEDYLPQDGKHVCAPDESTPPEPDGNMIPESFVGDEREGGRSRN